MRDFIPLQGSVDQNSPNFHPMAMNSDLVVTFNDEVQTRVVEYNITEGWIKAYVDDGKGGIAVANDEALIGTRYGRVEVSWKD